MMPVMLPRSLMVLVPKTGTRWCRKVVDKIGLPFTVIGGQNEWDGRMAIHAGMRGLPREVYEGRLVFGFVRHPLSWLESYWAHYGRAVDSRQHFPAWLGRIYDADFRTFLRRLIAAGYGNIPSIEMLGRLGFKRCDNIWVRVTRTAEFIGKTETLNNDFITALKHAGESFTPLDVLSQGPVSSRAVKTDLRGVPGSKELRGANAQLYEMFGYEVDP